MVLNWYSKWRNWKNETAKDSMEPKTKYDFYYRLEERDKLKIEELEPIMAFFESLPYNQRITLTDEEGIGKHYRIVHAWCCRDNTLSQEELNHAYIWQRTLLGNENSGECIVHGHTANILDESRDIPENRAGRIVFEESSNSINVDGGCCYKQLYSQYPCMLCGICLETLEEFYPCSFEERFKEFKREEYLPEDSRIEDFPAFITI